jgi:hypothetical protein
VSASEISGQKPSSTPNVNTSLGFPEKARGPGANGTEPPAHGTERTARGEGRTGPPGRGPAGRVGQSEGADGRGTEDGGQEGSQGSHGAGAAAEAGLSDLVSCVER